MKKILASLLMVLALAGTAFAGFYSIEGQAQWGVVKLTIDKNVERHFAITGWQAEIQKYDGYYGCTLRLFVDTDDDTVDTKGCLRASFYTTTNSGKKIRTPSVMTDDRRVHAMLRFWWGLGDTAIEPWSEVVIKWTADCRDTGNIYNSFRPEWVK